MALITACGGGSGDKVAATPAPPMFSQADVNFAVQLSQHHSQALHMADLAKTRARSAEVKALAAEIAKAYAPQVDTLAAWIHVWAAAGAELPGHDIGGGDVGAGMVSDQALQRLETLTGRAFDERFRAAMGRHHRGGLTLVAEVLAAGRNPEARALAEQLRADQTRQLAELR